MDFALKISYHIFVNVDLIPQDMGETDERKYSRDPWSR